MKEVKLPSGAVLRIDSAPFENSKALYQAILEELRAVPIVGKSEVEEMLKNMACATFSSKKVEAMTWACMEKVLYNNLRVSKDTFEPVEARGDYIVVCSEVIKENVSPFMKSLYAEFGQVLGLLGSAQA